MSRKEVVDRLKFQMERGGEEIFAMHRAGGGGLEVVRRNTDLMDGIVRRVYSHCREAALAVGEAQTDGMSLVALGGYGRGELNPQSDVDVLFLYRKMNRFVDIVVKEALYFLWDLGLRVGHSCRSVPECIKIAREDSTVKTSMIESRHICGDEGITRQLTRAIRKEFLTRGAADFIETKTREQAQRYTQYGDSSNYQEPNVKEGMGGLRDYHVALWCAKARYGAGVLDDLLALGVLTPEELQKFKEAYDFLHRVRNELHFTVKQRNDVLLMEVQRGIAVNLNYQGSDLFPAVELFMRDYFLRARDMERYSRLVIKSCGQRDGFFHRSGRTLKRKKVDHGLYSVGGEIVVEGDPFVDHPILLLKLFRHCQALKLAPGQSTLRKISQNLHHLDRSIIDSPQARDIFLEILSQEDAAGALRQMHDAGVLGKYIPEFEGLTSLAQHDLYHRYTVDEHVLRALKHLEDLKNAQEPELKELSTLYKRVRKPWLLKLAVLLHDIGKIRGKGHSETGAVIVSELAQRWDMDDKDCKRLRFLVENHLTMSHLSQRRNISDEKMVAGFVRILESEENLTLLYLLTYADTRGVGPHVWTTWKGALLWELYHETHNYFVRGGKPEYPLEDTLEQVKSRTVALLREDVGEEEMESYLHAMPYHYLTTTPPDRLVRHLELVRNLGEKSIALDQSHDFLKGSTELVVCTREKPGLFSNIAGTLSAMNINIIGAQIYTGTDGSVLDIMQVNGLDGKPVTNQETWDMVNHFLTRILEGKLTMEQLMAGRKKPLQARKVEHMEVIPKVTLDNISSDTHTVIDVIAQDKLGLLYSITDTLFSEGANIYLARISTEVHRAINSFYITDFEGRKIEDVDVLNELERKLLEAISSED